MHVQYTISSLMPTLIKYRISPFFFSRGIYISLIVERSTKIKIREMIVGVVNVHKVDTTKIFIKPRICTGSSFAKFVSLEKTSTVKLLSSKSYTRNSRKWPISENISPRKLPTLTVVRIFSTGSESSVQDQNLQYRIRIFSMVSTTTDLQPSSQGFEANFMKL